MIEYSPWSRKDRQYEPREKDNKNQQGPADDAGEKSMQIPGVNGKNKYQVVLRSGRNALNVLRFEFPGVIGKQQCQEVLRSGSR
jgi:hypothetical protein